VQKVLLDSQTISVSMKRSLWFRDQCNSIHIVQQNWVVHDKWVFISKICFPLAASNSNLVSLLIDRLGEKIFSMCREDCSISASGKAIQSASDFLFPRFYQNSIAPSNEYGLI